MGQSFPIEVVIAQDGAARAFLVIRATPPDVDIPNRCIVGEVELAGDSPFWPSFRPNPAFLEQLEVFLRGEAGLVPPSVEEGAVEPGEYFYLIDGRVAEPDGAVAPTDVIAAYETDDAGRPVLETMRRNPNHQLVTTDGTFSSLLSDELLHGWLAAGERRAPDTP